MTEQTLPIDIKSVVQNYRTMRDQHKLAVEEVKRKIEELKQIEGELFEKYGVDVNAQAATFSPTASMQRVNSDKLKATIMAIVTGNKKGVSHAEIVKHKTMIDLYTSFGKKVPSQAQLLGRLVAAKELVKKDVKYFTK